MRIAGLYSVLMLCGTGMGSARTAPAGSPIQADSTAIQPPVLIAGSCQAPAYPLMLRAARVQGRVLLQFAVDTLGRVEPASIRQLQSTHSQFEEAARRSLLTCRFRPARRELTPVRVLVQTPFTFTLPRT